MVLSSCSMMCDGSSPSLRDESALKIDTILNWSESARQGQEDHDHKAHPQEAAREIAPAPAVWPSRERPEKHQDEHNDQNGSQHFLSSLVAVSSLVWSPRRLNALAWNFCGDTCGHNGRWDPV